MLHQKAVLFKKYLPEFTEYTYYNKINRTGEINALKTLLFL